MTDLSNEEVVDIIVDMWSRDASGTMIARELTRRGAKHSRSAVMGKIHRLVKKGLIFKRKPTPAKLAATPKVEKKFIPDRTIKVEALRAKREKYTYRSQEIDTGHGVLFMDIRAFECRWVMDFERDGQKVFCGKEEHKRSFCKEHFDRCYYPAPKRRELTPEEKNKLRNTFKLDKLFMR